MKVWLVLLLVLGGALAVGACAGHDWASPLDLARAFAGDRDLRSRLLIEWRIPRVLAAALVGVLLGIGGAVFQGVFRNPLAEPYLLDRGRSGVGCKPSHYSSRSAYRNRLLLPVLAFAGAWVPRCWSSASRELRCR